MDIQYRGERLQPQFGLYRTTGRPSLHLLADVEPVLVATVNTVHVLDDNEAVLNEFEGDELLSALTTAGVVTDSGRRIRIGSVLAPIVRWTDAANIERRMQLDSLGSWDSGP